MTLVVLNVHFRINVNKKGMIICLYKELLIDQNVYIVQILYTNAFSPAI